MSTTKEQTAESLPADCPVGAVTEAPQEEASQNLRETFREMVSELVECCELLFQLTVRNIRIRYKQAVMGFGWASVMSIMGLCR